MYSAILHSFLTSEEKHVEKILPLLELFFIGYWERSPHCLILLNTWNSSFTSTLSFRLQKPKYHPNGEKNVSSVTILPQPSVIYKNGVTYYKPTLQNHFLCCKLIVIKFGVPIKNNHIVLQTSIRQRYNKVTDRVIVMAPVLRDKDGVTDVTTAITRKTSVSTTIRSLIETCIVKM